MTATMVWRQFTDRDDGQVNVRTFETPIGTPCSPSHSDLLAERVVTKEEAVEMVRQGVQV